MFAIIEWALVIGKIQPGTTAYAETGHILQMRPQRPRNGVDEPPTDSGKRRSVRGRIAEPGYPKALL